MEFLSGGRVNQIARIGKTIYRPASTWTPTIHKLLKHIREQGFLSAPEPFGFDETGCEIVSYIAGEVSNYPLSEAASSIEALISAAELLRAYHDASVSFVNVLQGNEAWMLPARQPADVICHGDYAPYNVVLHGNQAVGMIDFDTAHPAPRIWDIAYAVYRWAPLGHPANPDQFGGMQEKVARARLFCDAYGLSEANRAGLIAIIIERLQALVDFMVTEANRGNETFKANIQDGHAFIYRQDMAYLKANCQEIQKYL